MRCPRPLICVLLCVFLSVGPQIANAGVRFSSSAFPSNIYAPVLRFEGGVQKFEPITGKIVFESDTTSACARTRCNGTVYKDAVVFANGTYWRSVYGWMYDMAIPYGAKAVVLENGDIDLPERQTCRWVVSRSVARVDDSVGTAEFTTAPWSINYSIPILSISVVSLRSIYRAAQGLNATELAQILVTVDDSGGTTPWHDALLSPVWWFFSIFVSSTSCFLAFYAGIRLWQHSAAMGGFTLGVPQGVLIFELIGGVVRFVYWAVDPIWARSLIPPNVHTPIRTWSLPLSLSALLVLVFFWHETASSTSLRFSWSIERFKIPCYLIVISLFVLEISSNILYFMGGDISARAFTSYALPIIYILVGLGIASFLLVTSARIVLRLQKAVKSQNADDKFTHDSIRIRPIALKLLLVSSLYLALIFIAFYTLSTPYLQYVPNHYLYFWVTLHTVLNLRSYAAVWMLRPPQKQSFTNLRSIHLDRSGKSNADTQDISHIATAGTTDQEL